MEEKYQQLCVENEKLREVEKEVQQLKAKNKEL
jgi:hypothetical protein